MIARIDVHRIDDQYGYRVLADADVLYEDHGLSSVVHCLAGAVEGLPPQVRAVEVACGGVVSGTYPLNILATRVDEVAEHAVQTTASVYEALRD